MVKIRTGVGATRGKSAIVMKQSEPFSRFCRDSYDIFSTRGSGRMQPSFEGRSLGAVSQRASPKRPILFQRGSRRQGRGAAQGDGRGRGPARNSSARGRRQRTGDRDDGAGLGGHRKRRLKEAPVPQVHLIPWLA